MAAAVDRGPLTRLTRATRPNLGWNRFGAIGQARRNTNGRTAARNVAGHDRSSADLCKVADADVAENRRPRAEQHASADPGSTVRNAVFVAAATFCRMVTWSPE